MITNGCGSIVVTWNHIHHRCFHLQEAQIVEESPNVRDDLGAHVKLVSHALIDDQIEISLPESGFLVLHPVVQVWQHVQARGQEGDGLGNDGQLAFLGLSRMSANANNVTSSDLGSVHCKG